MEWLGEEEYNPGVPVWRGEPQVRRVISIISTVISDLDIQCILILRFPSKDLGQSAPTQPSCKLPVAHENCDCRVTRYPNITSTSNGLVCSGNERSRD